MSKTKGNRGEREVISPPNRPTLKEFARKSVVPPQIEGRQNKDRENWCLSRYILALESRGRLTLPLSVTRAFSGEAPDSVITGTTDPLGVEITDATTSEVYEDLKRAEESPSRVYIDMTAPGWAGDSPERTNAQLVLAWIEDKVLSLSSGRWLEAAYYDLVVYCDNLPGPGVDDHELISRVCGLLAAAPPTASDSYYSYHSFYTAMSFLI
jgi:hypothetical protein